MQARRRRNTRRSRWGRPIAVSPMAERRTLVGQQPAGKHDALQLKHRAVIWNFNSARIWDCDRHRSGNCPRPCGLLGERFRYGRWVRWRTGAWPLARLAFLAPRWTRQMPSSIAKQSSPSSRARRSESSSTQEKTTPGSGMHWNKRPEVRMGPRLGFHNRPDGRWGATRNDR